MRLKRAKQYKRNMALYQNSFKFREPYQVIVDGNFLNVCKNMKLDPRESLHQVLMGEVKLMTTYCVCAELRSLGTDFVYVADLAKSLEKRRCTHTTQISAKECILSIIGNELINVIMKGDENKYNYCIATQDADLRESLRLIPGTPLVYANKSVVILEPLSESSRLKIREQEIEKNQSQSFEKSLLKGDVKKKHSGPSKKRKIKEPNSLSVKKKKKVEVAEIIKGDN